MKQSPLSQKARRIGPPPISWMMKFALENPDLISLAAGFVDQETLPTRAVLACCRAVLRDEKRGKAALQYGTTVGHQGLRESILGLLAEEEGLTPENNHITADHVVVTTGSQAILYLATEALVDPGDVVIISDPSYFVYMGILEGVGADVRGVPIQKDGMDVGAVRAVVEQLRSEGKLDRLKIIYVVSYFQNPSGVTMSAKKRRALFDLVQEIRDEAPVFILEDGAYRELRYRGRKVPPIKLLDTNNDSVIYAGTFCKPFSAGLKTGYGIVPDALLDAVLYQKGNLNFGSSNFTQYIIDEAIRTGKYRRHVSVVRRGYKAKLQVMLDALQEFMPGEARWLTPKGGLYVWAATPESIDTGPHGDFFQLAVDKGILYVPGEFCYYPEPGREKPRNWMRLSFGVETPENVREGIRRLAEAVKETLAG